MAAFAARTQSDTGAWRTLARAMGQTGGASLASGLLSLLATKIIAVTLGPAHVAVLATLQQLRQTGLTGGTLTGQTALVQGASALRGQARREYLRTVLCLMAAASTVVAAVFMLAPQWTASHAGLTGTSELLTQWLSVAVVLGMAYVFVTGLLNASGAIGKLALVQLAAPAALALLAYPVARGVAAGHPGWLTALVVASAVVALAGAGWAALRERDALTGWLSGAGAWWRADAARRFFAISGSMFASGLFSSWVLITVRARILRSEGLATGGQFDAAWALSMNQTGLVLASLQTYYLPALARSRDRSERAAQIGHVLTLAALASALLIAVLAAVKPTALTLLYSGDFTGASRYLRWTLAGDYLKITSWILSIPLLAAANMRAFLAADVAAWGTFALAAWALPRWTSGISLAEAAAMAFALMYAVHLIFCGACLWSQGEFRPGKSTVLVWSGGLALVASASAAFWNLT